MKLSQTEFAYNHATKCSMGFSPFQVMYSALSHGLFNLIHLPAKTRVHWKGTDFVTSLQDIHKIVLENLTTVNARYKQHAEQHCYHVEFELGDFVWVMLPKKYYQLGTTTSLNKKGLAKLR